jgi:geranylgeranyl reductase family protein
VAERFEVVVIGAGPAGASCAYWLAKAGHEVVVVEKKSFPREKTCGDGLTPRAVRQLEDMGLGAELASSHRYEGLRSHGFGCTLELPWPETPGLPRHGYVVTRKDLDALVAARAVKAGAELWEHTEAVGPVLDGGLAQGARLVASGEGGRSGEVRGEYLVVADGANSRFGWALGTSRQRSYPQGMALRGYWSSPLSSEPWIDSWLDVRDAEGRSVPGYGWVFPLGDGRVNVGVGLLSTSSVWKGANTARLMEAFCQTLPPEWGVSKETVLGPLTGGRLPMGLSVGPRSGPRHLVVGDAAGAINPFNGEGIAYGYETGRLAAEVIAEALASGNPAALATYEDVLSARYGLYYKVARAFVSAISHPQVMRICVATGMHSRTLMEWVLRIMSNSLRPDELGPAEAAYKALVAISWATSWKRPTVSSSSASPWAKLGNITS